MSIQDWGVTTRGVAGGAESGRAARLAESRGVSARRRGGAVSRRTLIRGGVSAGGAIAVASCGPAGGTAGTGTGAGAESKGPVEIYFTLPAAAGLEQDLYTGFLNDFHARQNRIRVSHVFEADFNAYPAKLKALLAADTWPDIAHQHLSVVQDFSQQGALSELKPYLNRDKINEKDFIPALITEFTWRGKLMAIPKDSAAFGVHYNKDMFDEAGIKYPDENWTWDQFAEISRRLTKPDQGQFAVTVVKPAPNSEQWEAALKV